MKRIRTALIGCGSIGVFHMSATQLVPEIQMVAMVDKDLPWSKAMGEKYGVSQHFSDPEQVLGKVDLVIIATPNYLHAPLSKKFLENGVSVLCEKPMALSAADAQLMIEASCATGAKLAIGFNRRFRPSFIFLKHILEQHWLGDVQEFEYHDGFIFTSDITRTNYVADRKLSGGGALIDFGIHGLDAICWLLGEPQVVSYQDDLQDPQGIENNVELELSVQGRIKGWMVLSRTKFLKNTFTIRGTNGWVEMGSGDALKLKVFKKDAKVCSRLGPTTITTAWRTLDFSDQLQDIASAILHNREPRVNGQEGLKSLRVVEACYSGIRINNYSEKHGDA